MKMQKTVFRVSGMTCGHCEKQINEAVKRVSGVRSVAASYPKKRVEVSFDAEKTPEEAIRDAIEREGYRVLVSDGKKHPFDKVAPVFLSVLALFFIVKYTIGFDFISFIPQIDETVSLVALFATGLLTSVHCVAMCGGINLSQSVGAAEDEAGKLKRPLLYNLGRVISYTAVGGVVGGVGSVLFVSQTVKGIIMLVAAAFMILMSLSMLGWLPWWLVPRLPKALARHANRAKAGRGPLAVGLLNGLLPCGPLQAMQLYALSTGSVLLGAFSMMLFALGTVPLMLGAGLVFSMLKGRFTRVVTRVSAALVMLIALLMAFNAGGLFGWNLIAAAGSEVPAPEAENTPGSVVEDALAKGYAVAEMKDGVQVVEAKLARSGYPLILVEKGAPVRFNLSAEKSALSGCNATVVFPTYGVEKRLQAGDNIIEFTPDETGTFSYTCWMGMLYGKVVVVDDLGAGATAVPDEDITDAEQDDAPPGLSGCCG